MITNRKLLIGVVLFVCAVIYNFYLLKAPINIYDEGIVLVGADRIVNDDLPYIDFFSMYPPGQFYILASLFKFLGTSVMTERIYDLIIRSLLPVLIFLIIKKIGTTNAIAVIGSSMVLMLLGSFESAGYPVYSAMLLVLISAYFFFRDIEKSNSYSLIYSGVFMTFAALFRHDLAGYAAIGMLLTLLLKKIADKESGFRPIYHFTYGLLLTGIPIAILLHLYIGLDVIIEQLIIIPSDIMHDYRWIPYPTQLAASTVQFYIYPLALFLGLFFSNYIIFKLKIRNKSSYGMLLFSLIGILFINQVIVRSDAIHLLPASMFAIVVSLSLFLLILSSREGLLSHKLFKIASYALLCALFILMIPAAWNKLNSLNSSYFSLSDKFNRAGYSSIAPELKELNLYIRSNTDADDAIYVGVENHDKFIINDVAVYFLAGRKYANKYHELHPGVTNLQTEQKDIVQEIKDAGVKLIVLSPRYWYEPNDTRIDSKVDYLDNYIRKYYKITANFGDYEVWEMR